MKFKYIDSVRGIAILMVIMVHVAQTVKGLSPIPYILAAYGQMGVQLFFVASAYTLCLSANNRVNELHPIRKYAIRRYFRIAPIYYIGGIIYFLFAIINLQHIGGIIHIPNIYTFSNLLTNVLFLHGFYPSANNNIVPGGWSIGTEMGFYVIFPILFYFAKKIMSSSRKIVLMLILSTFAFSQLILALLFFFTDYYISNNNFLYYNIITQLPVFCIGIGYYIFEQNGSFNTHWNIDLIAFILLTCLSLQLWTMQIPHLFSVIPFISALSFVFLINIFKKNKSLNLNILARIGTVSYSMYIIHFLFAYMLSEYIAFKFSAYFNDYILLVLLFLMSVTGTFIIAIVSELYIERPFIEMGQKIISKIK